MNVPTIVNDRNFTYTHVSECVKSFSVSVFILLHNPRPEAGVRLIFSGHILGLFWLGMDLPNW